MGQDLVRLELGGAPEGGEQEKGSSELKEPASSEQSTSSDPEPSKKDESKPKEESSPQPPPQEKKPEPKKDTLPPKKPEPKTENKPSSSAPALGNREERRVRESYFLFEGAILTIGIGEDESYALANCGTAQAISKHCSFPYNVQ